jgi:hypothetical protein
MFWLRRLDCSILEKNYAKILSDKREFGQLTPANGQKVRFFLLALNRLARMIRERDGNYDD